MLPYLPLTSSCLADEGTKVRVRPSGGLLGEVQREADNGRLLRLLMKLCYICERPELGGDSQWAAASEAARTTVAGSEGSMAPMGWAPCGAAAASRDARVSSAGGKGQASEEHTFGSNALLLHASRCRSFL